MQKWEYRFVECIYYMEDWYPAFEDGEEIRDWKTAGNITVYANRLGEEGWELVNFASSAVGSHSDYREFFRVAFRRPKSG
jgi:hypothetical protein